MIDEIHKRLEAVDEILGSIDAYDRYQDGYLPEPQFMLAGVKIVCDYALALEVEVEATKARLALLEAVREASNRHLSAVIAYENALCDGVGIEEHDLLAEEKISALIGLEKTLAACEAQKGKADDQK